MKMKKTIYFFNIIIKNKPMSQYVSPEVILSTVFNTHMTKVSTEDQREIVVKKNNNEEFFASYGAKKEESNILFERELEPESNEIIYPADRPPRLIEKYTYFYINYKMSAMAVIRNDNVPPPKNYIQAFIKNNVNIITLNVNNSYIFGDVDILEMPIQDLKKKLKQLNKASELKFVFTGKVNSSSMPGVFELYNAFEDELSKVQLTLKFKNTIKTKNITDRIEEITKNQNNIESLKLTGLFSDSGAEEIIDIIKKTLSRQVEIELDAKAPESKEENNKIEELIFTIMKKNLLTQTE